MLFKQLFTRYKGNKFYGIIGIHYLKNERRIVAATMRKIQAPNQEAALFEVSGSPEENFE